MTVIVTCYANNHKPASDYWQSTRENGQVQSTAITLLLNRQQLRKSTQAFAQLFNQIQLVRRSESSESTLNTATVPVLTA